jgi:hypothetical protein
MIVSELKRPSEYTAPETATTLLDYEAELITQLDACEVRQVHCNAIVFEIQWPHPLISGDDFGIIDKHLRGKGWQIYQVDPDRSGARDTYYYLIKPFKEVKDGSKLSAKTP